MEIRIALVQPRSHTGSDEARHIDEAIEWLDAAAEQAADLVVFPEGYPGPTNPANSFDAFGPLSRRAAERRIHVVAGRVEPASGHQHHVSLHLIGDDGATIGVYRRSSPIGPYIYHDIDAWQFDYEASAQAPSVFGTRLGRIGLLVCSEVYVPELSRLLALGGADLLLFPAGGAINELRGTWRTMVHARAIENLAFAAATQNLYASDEKGIAMIASPEAIVAERDDPGLLTADLDFDRLAFLRREDERIEFPKRYRTIPGVLRWRRPELYDRLGRPSADPPEYLQGP